MVDYYTSSQLRAQELAFRVIEKERNVFDKPEAIRWTGWWARKKDDAFTFFPAETVPTSYPVSIYVSSKILDDKNMKEALLHNDLGFYGWGHRGAKNLKGVTDPSTLRFLTDYQDLSKFLGQKDGTFSVYFWLPTEKKDKAPILLFFMPKGEWINASRFSEGNTGGLQFPKESLKELSSKTIDDPLNDYLVSQLGVKVPKRGIMR